MSTPNNVTKVVTGKVRLSYVHIFERYAQSGKEEDKKYSCVLLIPKTDKVTLKKMRDAQQSALSNNLAKLWNNKTPKDWGDTIKDGDEADLERNPEFAGHWYLTVSSKTKPGVVDGALNEIIDSTAIYSGCYAKASINAFAYNYQGKKGITFGLNHIQKVADGDYLGGRSRAEDDFEVIEEEEAII